MSEIDLLDRAQTALDAAKTPYDVDRAHRRLTAAVLQQRKDGSRQLAASFLVAMEIWDAQKDEGVSLEERQAGLYQTIRAAWPTVRDWKYLCDDCDDTGWQFLKCEGHTPCGRPFRLPNAHSDDFTGRGRCTPGHTYCRPCFCEKGRGFNASLMRDKRGGGDDLTALGKTKDSGGFSRAGRRG